MPFQTSGTATFKGYVKNSQITAELCFSLTIGIMNWHLKTNFGKRNKEEMLNIKVIGLHEYKSTNLWSCDTNIELKIEKKDGTEEPIGTRDCYFDRDSMEFMFRTPLKKNVLLAVGSEYVIDKLVLIKGYIRVNSSSGIGHSIDFSFPNNSDSEVTLLLNDDQKLYVDKYLLMAFSSVFRTMFHSESQENQIEIKDVKYQTLFVFLWILSHQKQVISDGNVEDLLVLAYRYDVQFLVSNCEDVLVSSSKISNMDKVRIAEMYRLTKLQDKALNDLSDGYPRWKIDEVIKGVENDPLLSDETKKAAIQELLIDKFPPKKASSDIREMYEFLTSLAE